MQRESPVAEIARGSSRSLGLNFVHHDFKCDTIMVGMNDKAKLIDFGLSCLLGEVEIKVD